MVWIDQDLCAGDGTWVVKEQAEHCATTIVFDGQEEDGNGPGRRQRVSRVPVGLVDAVVQWAEECPGECITIETCNAEIIANRGTGLRCVDD